MFPKRIAAWLAAIAAAGTLAACHGGDTAHTDPATNVTATSATLRASGHTHNSYNGRYRLDHRVQGGAWQAGTWKNWGNPNAPCDETGPQQNFSGSQNVTGLEPQTTYESRLLIDFCPPGGALDAFDSSNPHDQDPPNEYHSFRTDPSFGVVELDGQLTQANIGNVPTEAVRIIYGSGEYPYDNPNNEAANHVQMLLNAGKLPVTTLQVVDWRDIPVATWEQRVSDFVETVPSPIIEIGNEPGSHISGGYDEVLEVWDAYFVRLKAVSDDVRDAGKKLILGGNPPGTQGGNPGAQDFFNKADQANIWPHVDGVGLHPYMPDPNQQINYIAARRQQLTDPPISFTGPRSTFYFTEFGWGSGNNGEGLNVGEATQAEYLTDAFTYFGNRSDVSIATWFSWKDQSQYGTNWADRAGVRRWDGTSKPSYFELAEFANP